jgi:hypothetical protein
MQDGQILERERQEEGHGTREKEHGANVWGIRRLAWPLRKYMSDIVLVHVLELCQIIFYRSIYVHFC